MMIDKKKVLLVAGLIVCVGCERLALNSADIWKAHSPSKERTLTVIARNRPNGYDVSLFIVEDSCLLYLQRGDSIRQYIHMPIVPRSLRIEQTEGKLRQKLNIPTKRKLDGDIFFMDVNFDGDEELVIKHLGYNRAYYVCYDIIHGTSSETSYLTPICDEPYNNLVGPMNEDVIYGTTTFDYETKTIRIEESLGVSCHYEVIAVYSEADHTVKVVKKTETKVVCNEMGWAEGFETRYYEPVNDSLILIKTEFTTFNEGHYN